MPDHVCDMTWQEQSEGSHAWCLELSVLHPSPDDLLVAGVSRDYCFIGVVRRCDIQ